MRYDIYLTGDEARICKWGVVDPDGFLPEEEPVKVMKADDDWREWCEDHGGDYVTSRVFRKVAFFDEAFVEDLRKKAQSLMDEYIARGKEAGWGSLEIDHSWVIYTYRQSAAWKEEPTLYTMEQSLKWTDRKSKGTSEVFYPYLRLQGMATAVYELGMHIVFDKDFKIQVRGVRCTWKREDFD